MIFKSVWLSFLINMALLATAKKYNLLRRLLGSGDDVLPDTDEYEAERLACHTSCCFDTCFTSRDDGWYTESYGCDNNGNYVVLYSGGPGNPKPTECDETGPLKGSKILIENSKCCDTSEGMDQVTLEIEIDSCSEWIYVPNRESLQIQFSGSDGISKYVTIDKNSNLPVNGERKRFIIETDDIGDLESISLAMYDNPGYCLKMISVYGFNQDVVFKNSFFGNGIILAQNCPYSYYELSSSLPLISCVAADVNDEFNLYVNSPRGIYELDILSCNLDNYRDSIKKRSLHASIMGQKNNSAEYITINPIYLDYLLTINRNDEQFEIIEFSNSDPQNGFLSWNEANNKCKELYNTELVSISSQSQEELLRSKLEGLGKNQMVFIGLGNSQYKWVDGSQLYYKDFTVLHSYPKTDDSDILKHNCTFLNFDYRPPNQQIGKQNEIGHQYYAEKCDEPAGFWYDYWAYVCNTPKLSKNEHRIFEINVETNLLTIDLISITNDDNKHSVCIDDVFIDGKQDIYSDTSRAFGGDEDEDTLVKVFSYPVCKTEIIGITHYEIKDEPTDQIKIGGDNPCINYDRVEDLICEINIEKSLTTETVVTLSASEEYSWGTSTSNTNGEQVEDSFSLTFSGEFGDFGVEDSKSWTHTDYSEETTENSNEQSESNSNENSWAQSETTTVACTATLTAIPWHEKKYEVVYETGQSIYDITYNVLLTPCDDSIEAEIVEIPGSIQVTDTIGCTIVAMASEPLENTITCDDHINQAIASGSTYIPKCQTENTELYDGCQCDIGDSLTMAVCWCSDELGNLLPVNPFQFGDSDKADQVCVEELMCENTERVYP